MQLPLTDPDTLFEELLQDLPAEVAQRAREFPGFVRAKKVKTPEQLLRMGLLYWGLDKSLRTGAGVFTALYEPITDQAVAERFAGVWAVGESPAPPDAAPGPRGYADRGETLSGH